MAERERRIEIGFLNVVATPHPPGVYERLFRFAAGRQVRYFGDNTAAITNIRARPGENAMFTGQILTWVDIDPSSPAINKSMLEEVALSEDVKRLTSAVGFNGKVFKFILDAQTHTVVYEALNDTGKRLAPSRAHSIFEKLLSPETLGPDAELVDVTVIPEDDALSYVLQIPRLDRIDIIIKRPNADDVTKETYDVLAELEAQNAKKQEIILIRAPQTEGLRLNEKNETYARVASEGNGHVSAKGRGDDGEPEVRSTRQYPKVLERVVAAGATFLSTLADAARETRAGRPRA